MGLDYQMFKSISEAVKLEKWELLPEKEYDLSFAGMKVPNLHFELSKGWR